MSKRIISGIQPSGNLHLGNYFGAIKQQIAMQDSDECLFFIADYHALTSLKDPEALERFSREVAATYLALGLDPKKAILFRQSDCPQTTELAWLLGCTTGVGQFLRAHAYKDKVEQGLPASMGLFSYPLLMAADILLYKATHVPVGKDQIQHLEMTADIAGGFNATYGEKLVKPQVVLSESPYVPGTDGRKMSKSYKNTIPIFWDSNKGLKKAVNAIVTDSKDPSKEALDPDTCNAFAIYALFATPEEQADLADLYHHDREFPGYGVTKQLIIEKMKEQFGEACERYHELMNNPGLLDSILDLGAARAQEIGKETLDECRKLVGLD